MKMLTATAETRGQHPRDYHNCIPGELVTFPTLICHRDAANPDGGGCGCGRGWAGLNSHKATTAIVSDVAITPADYTEAITSSLDQQGWGGDDAQDIAEHLASIAAGYPAGTVLGHRLRNLYVRATPVDDANR
jgi:hypothetical protein